MACGCSNTTTASTIPYLFKGGGRKSKSKSKRKSKRKSKSKSSKKKRKLPQRGGIGIFGDMTSNAVKFSNSLTGSFTGNNAVSEQPAGKLFSNNGNAYVV